MSPQGSWISPYHTGSGSVAFSAPLPQAETGRRQKRHRQASVKNFQLTTVDDPDTARIEPDPVGIGDLVCRGLFVLCVFLCGNAVGMR